MTRLVVCVSVLLMLAPLMLRADVATTTKTADKEAPAKPPTASTHRVKIGFARDTLKRALEMLSVEIGVPIGIERLDLQLEGITVNQSFGMPAANRTVDEFIRECLTKTNPDGQLAYVVRKIADSQEMLVIVSLKGAAMRGETLFPDFALQPLLAKAEINEPKPWSSIIRAETIESEVRRQIEVVGKALQGKWPEPKVRGAISQLAMLFRVIDEYEGQIRWKRDAVRIWRDLYRDVRPGSTWSEMQQEKAAALYDDLEKLLATDAWPRNVAARPEEITWQQMAPRAQFMRRIQPAVDEHLAIYTGREENQVAVREELQREAEVVAALAQAMQAGSYEYADDAEYLQLAKQLGEQAKSIAAAASKKNAAELKLQVQQLQKTCSACHVGFRG